MPAPPLPANEADRLAALRSLMRLPTVLDQLESLASLARTCFGAVSAGVQLVDERTVYAVQDACTPEAHIDRDVSFAAHVIVQDEPFVVPDAHSDPRFAEHPWVKRGTTGAYAGVPIEGPDGSRVAVFSVHGPEPRAFSAEDLRRLEEFRSLAATLMSAASSLHLAEEHARLARSLLNGTGMGVALCRAVRGEDGQPVDFRFEAWNDLASAALGIGAGEFSRSTVSELLPNAESLGLLGLCRHALESGERVDTTKEYRDDRIGGWFRFVAERHDAERIVVSFLDITEGYEAKQRVEIRERDLSLFIEHAPAAVAMFDREMRYLSASKRWMTDHYGVGVDVIGALHYDLHPDLPERYRQVHKRSLEGEVVRCEHDRYEMPDGRVIWSRWECRPWYDARGEIGGVVVMSEDITARIEAEHRQGRYAERLRLVLEATGLGMWDWNLEDGTTVYSENWFRMLGYEAGRLPATRETFRKLAHPDDYPEAEARFAAHARGEDPLYKAELRLLRNDGKWMWVEDVGRVVEWTPDGKPQRAVGVYIDLQARKESEQALARHAEATTAAMRTVEQQAYELSRKNLDLERARRSAETANRAKSAFLANMSHELRTPMTAILGFAQVLVDDPDAKSHERREYIDAIRRNGEHLLELVSDILDLSKIDAERMRIELAEFDMTALLSDAVGSVGERAQRAGVRLEARCLTPIPTHIVSDAMRVRQIVLNLLSNAVKFTANGSVTMELSVSEEDPPASLVIDVVDTGTGIDPAMHDRIFDAFAQADDSTTRRFGGTGLGLSISRSLAVLLRGSLELVHSEPGKGSRFRLVLPAMTTDRSKMVRALGEAKPEAPARAEGTPTLRARVLVAEDGRDNQRLIRHTLTRAGAEVELVENGREAVDAYLRASARGEPYDIILMDMQMPVMDGYSAANELRARGCRSPIIALTAHALKDDRERCLVAGCDEHVTKPFKPGALILACRLLLGEQNQDSEAA